MFKYVDKKNCTDFLLSLDLFNCNDDKKYIKILYSISNNIEKNYSVFKIKKRNGKYRTIYEPKPLLKHIQKQILNNFLNEISISKYAKAYCKGVSLKDNASPHINKKVLLKLDIKDFFDNISIVDIYKSCFNYFPESIGMLLTHLCCYGEFLPQGAPTSAYISNLVMKEFDEELGKWCDDLCISYTRYSDDMTFSGDFNVSLVITKVRKMLYRFGMELNNDKIHVVNRSSCQSVTGIVVNEKLQVCSKYRRAIRQEVYYIKKFGLDSHLKFKGLDFESYLDSLYGRILYVLQINDDLEFEEYKKFIFNIKEGFYD